MIETKTFCTINPLPTKGSGDKVGKAVPYQAMASMGQVHSLAHLGRVGNGAGESLRGRMALGIRATLPGYVSRLDGKLTKFADDIETGVETLAKRTGAQSDDMAKPTGKSIFDEDDGADEAAPHPFAGVDQGQDDDDDQPEDARTAAERVADGEGDEPIY